MKKLFISTLPFSFGKLLTIALLLISAPGMAHARVTLLESEGVKGAAANGHSYNPSISDDGNYTLFESMATNLPGSESGSFLYDADDYSLTFLGSISNAVISGDGQTVTFSEESAGAVRIGQFAMGGGDEFHHPR